MIHSAAEEKRAAARLALGLAYITARERITLEFKIELTPKRPA